MTQSSHKQDILTAIRKHHLPEAALPNLDQAWTTYADPRQQFSAMLATVGGRCVVVPDERHIRGELEQMAAYQQAQRVCSMVPGAGRSDVNLQTIGDPHELEDIDFAILPGEFAVAENAAVWVTDEGLPHRAVYFIAQHSALVVPAREIVNNMHEAYHRLAFDRARFGAFISGPSKTADIEQSLVIGAHGPRSLTVFLVEAL